MPDITIKRYNGTIYEDLHPATTIAQVDGLTAALGAKIESSVIGQANGVASLNGAGTVPESQLPASVFGGMRYVGTINVADEMTDLHIAVASYVATHGGTPIGCYFIAAGDYQMVSNINDEMIGDQEGANDGAFWVQTQDWLIVSESDGTTFGWSNVNNTYNDASTTTKGVVELSSATVYATLAGDDVITNYRLKTLIDNANFSVDGHNHDATYLGIHSTADAALKLATARTISLSGDASGSASFDGSANVTITVAVANDSHTHDGRYYTETEVDGIIDGLNEFIYSATQPASPISGDIWLDY